MANRRFEMFEYRQVLTRMRLGDTDRAIARVGLMGRRKVAQLRRTAEAAGWLDVATPLPGDPELGAHLGSVRTPPAVASLAEPHRERITRWWRQGVQGTTIHGALVGGHRKVCSQNYSKGPKHLDSDFNASSLRFCKPLPGLFRAVWRLDRVTIRSR